MAGRRGNGEGSIYRRKDGRWEGRYTVQTPTGTKRRTVYGKTREEARKKLTKAVADRDGGLVFDDENMTVGEYLDGWLKSSVRGSVRESTRDCYEIICRTHVRAVLGHIKLSKLTAMHVQRFYRDRLDSGLSPATVHKCHTVLHKALKQAVEWNLVARNAADAAKPPRPTPRKEMRPLSPEEARRLLDAASEAGDRLEALYVLAVSTGMREGELLGLKWADVDLGGATGSLRVRRTLTRHGGKVALGEPKTKKSRRTVRLTPRAVESLKRHRARQAGGEAQGRLPVRGRGPRLRGRGRRARQPLEPPPEVLRAAPQRGGAPGHILPRPPPHLRLAAVPEERPPQVRPGAPRALLRLHNPRHLLPHAAGHGRRGRGRHGRRPGVKKAVRGRFWGQPSSKAPGIPPGAPGFSPYPS